MTALVTHYALVHPEKHFELVSASHTLVSAPPVTPDRRADLPDLRQGHAGASCCRWRPSCRWSAPAFPSRRRGSEDPDEAPRDPGRLRLSGFYSKPELQKLNRNSIYIFINKRLVRDRLLLHAITEAYRNVIPPTSFPVVLLFLELPPEEVDVNVHPAKTEVRFRQQSVIHDFVRDSLRTALIKARPAAGFLAALDSAPSASPSLMPPATSPLPGSPDGADGPDPPDSEPPAFRIGADRCREPFRLTPQAPAADSRQAAVFAGSLPANGVSPISRPGAKRRPLCFSPRRFRRPTGCSPNHGVSVAYGQSPALATAQVEAEQAAGTLNHLGSLKPLGQLRESFILAVGRRRPLDHRPARRPRAGAVRKDPARPQGGKRAAPAAADAHAGGAEAVADGGFCPDRRGTGAQRI